jgi:tetratricopeptide (TPR) repeat protein
LEKGKGAMDPEEIAGGRLKVRWLPLYRRILAEVEKEIEIHPNYADLQNQFALLLAIKGEWTAAERHLLKAFHLNPRYREAILNLGHLYIERERWKEAEEIFLSEARKHPKDGFLHHVLGVSYFRTKRWREAALHIGKAIKCHPYYRGYYQERTVWHRGKVHLDQKTERIFKKIPLNYHYAQFHNLVGLYLARRGKSTQAVRELRKAAKLEPDEFLFHANLGTVYYHQGVYQKAIQEYKQALKIDSFYGMGYANLSYVYGLLRRTREALRHMEGSSFEPPVRRLAL